MARINSTGATPLRGSSVDVRNTTLAWTPTVGNVLIVTMATWKSGGTTLESPGSVTDSYGNTWAVAATSAVNSNAQAHIAYCEVETTGAAFNVAIDPNGSGIYLEWAVEEWSDLDTASLLRGTGLATGSSAAGSVVSTSGSPVSGDVAIAVLSVNGDSNISLTTATGFTRGAYNADAANTIGYEACYKELSGSGAVTATWGHDSSTWSAAIAIFSGLGGGGSTVKPWGYYAQL